MGWVCGYNGDFLTACIINIMNSFVVTQYLSYKNKISTQYLLTNWHVLQLYVFSQWQIEVNELVQSESDQTW